MGLLTGRDLHVDQHLTNLAINFRPQNFIADQIAPIVPVNKASNTYPVFSQAEMLAIEDDTRAPGQEARKITRSVSSARYEVKNYALASDIFAEDLANMDDAYRYELDTGRTRYLVSKLGLGFEKRILTLAANTTSVSTVFVVNSTWGTSGANGGDPIAAYWQAKEQMQATVAYAPNSILIGWRAHQRLMRNYQARNFIKGVNNGGGMVNRDSLAAAFEVDRYIVSEAFYHTYNEAQLPNPPTAVASLSNPISDMMILYYRPPGVSRDDPSWMYAFRWQDPSLPAPFVVERHPYDTKRKMETLEAAYYQDERITGVGFASIILTNVASGALGLG